MHTAPQGCVCRGGGGGVGEGVERDGGDVGRLISNQHKVPP